MAGKMLAKWRDKVSDIMEDGYFKLTLVPSIAKEFYQTAQDHYRKFRHNIQNLRDANIDLGLYHLQKGNYTDAILRFKLVTKFIKPEDEESYNYLAWTYYLTGDLPRAKKYITKAKKAGDVKLAKFLSDDSPSVIPEYIIARSRDFIAEGRKAQYSEVEIAILSQFVDELFDHVDELPKDCQILDINCGVGMLGEELHSRLQRNYRLTGIEISPQMLEQAKALRDNKTKLYDSSFVTNLEDFTKKAKAEFDIICSLFGLKYNSVLKDDFGHIKQLLKENGICALLFDYTKGDVPRLNEDSRGFVYPIKYIEAQLKLAKLTIVDIKELDIATKRKYIVAICSK